MSFQEISSFRLKISRQKITITSLFWKRPKKKKTSPLGRKVDMAEKLSSQCLKSWRPSKRLPNSQANQRSAMSSTATKRAPLGEIPTNRARNKRPKPIKKTPSSTRMNLGRQLAEVADGEAQLLTQVRQLNRAEQRGAKVFAATSPSGFTVAVVIRPRKSVCKRFNWKSMDGHSLL